jgi:hypothetical protein
MSDQDIPKETRAFFDHPGCVVNVGLVSFGEALRRQNVEVIHVDWHPPKIEIEPSPATRLANMEAWEQLDAGEPRLLGVRPAGEVIVGWPERTVICPGPPIPEGAVLPPALADRVVSALLVEGWANDFEEGSQLLVDAKVSLAPSAAWNAVLPAFTVLSPSTLVFVVEDKDGRRAFGPLWQSPADGASELSSRNALARSLDAALIAVGGLDLVELAKLGLSVGDAGYGPGPAGRAILFLHLVGLLTQVEEKVPARWLDLLRGESQLYLHLLLPMARLLSNRVVRPEASLVTRMGGNGLGFGLAIGSEWVVSSPVSPKLAFVGDDPMLEVIGLGAMALAGSPSLALHLGMRPAEGIQMTLEMYEITQGASHRWQIPLLEPRGVPMGLNSWYVLDSGLLPSVVCRTGTSWELMPVPEELFRTALT